jgi:hypothetical protein
VKGVWKKDSTVMEEDTKVGLYKEQNHSPWVYGALIVKIFFLGLYILFYRGAVAQVPTQKIWWDSSAYLNSRNYPLGVSLGGFFGLGYTAWNATRAGQGAGGNFLSPYLYGYLRTQARVQTSGVVNSADLRLEIFPISFLGLTVGKNLSARAADFSAISCSEYLCQGSVDRSFVSGILALGAAGFSVLAYGRYDDMRASSAQGDSFLGRGFYDEMASIRGLSLRDQLQSLDLLATYEVDSEKKHRLGILNSRARFLGSRESAESLYAMWIYNFGKYTLQTGVGTYESSFQKRAFSAFAGFKWTPKKGAGLF